jgi:hypothetical protein
VTAYQQYDAGTSPGDFATSFCASPKLTSVFGKAYCDAPALQADLACNKMGVIVTYFDKQAIKGDVLEALREAYALCISSSCLDDPTVLSSLQAAGRSACELTATPSCKWNAQTADPKLPRPLPRWRLGVGIGALILGGLSMSLGTAHMFTPVFKTSGGCSSMGVDSECAADRFGLGVPLVMVGVVGVVGGGLALGLKNY